MPGPRIGEAVITIGSDATGFDAGLAKQTSKAAKSTGEQFSKIMGKGLRTGAIAVGGAVSGILGTAIVEGFKRLNAIDQATAKLKGLGHSAGEVKTIMGNALTSVKGTAYGLGEAASQAANLVASGIKPGKDLTRTLSLLADTATISGASLGAVGQIFGKVAAGGKLTTEVLKQLQDRGVPVLKFLADQTGKSMAQVSTDITKGKISFATFQSAMEKGLGGAAKSSGDTFTGALANMRAALGRLGAALLGGAFSKMPALFKTIIGWIDQLTPTAERVGAKIGSAFSVAVGWVTSFKTKLGGLSGSGSPWAALAAGVAGLAVILGHFLSGTKSMTAFMEGLTGKAGKLSSVFKVLSGPVGIIAGLFVYAYTTSKPFREAINTLLGTLGDLAGQISTALVPVFSTLLGTFGELAKVALPIVAGGLSVVVGILQTFTPLIVFLAPKVVLLLVALRTAGLVIQGVGVAFRVLSAIMAVNPFVLILAAVAAVAAGIYYLATKTRFFQTVWAAVWGAVKAATAATVGWLQTSVWPVIQAGINGVVTAFQWLSTTATNVWSWISSAAATFWGFVQPILAAVYNVVANVLTTAFNIWWGVVFRIFQAIQILALAWWKAVGFVFDLAKAGLGFLGDKFTWLYVNVVKPVFGWIGSLISSWWKTGVAAVFTLAKAGLGFLGAKFSWLYDNIVKPVFGYIYTKISTTWTAISTVFGWIKGGIGFVGDKFSSFYTGTVKPIWDKIGSVIKGVWDYTVSKIFTAMKTGVSLVATAFGIARDSIKTAWDALKAIASAPIHFILDTVINKGLIGGFNWLSSKVGGPHIANVPVPFKTGGVLSGYTPGRDVHQFTSPTGGRLDLSGGEAVMVPEWTRAVGGKAAVDGMNRAARAGRAFKNGGVLGGSFAGGGIIGWIKSKAASAFDWVKDKAGALWQALSHPLDFLKSHLPSIPGGQMIADAGRGVVGKAASVAGDKIKSLFSVFNGGYDKVIAERAAAASVSGPGPGGAAGIPPGSHGLSLRAGVRLDTDTMARIARAAAHVAMRVIQGSWQNYGPSQGTHLGAGAADIHAASWSGGVNALRAQGMLAMFRNWAGNQHIHTINPNISGLSRQAQQQVRNASRNHGYFQGGGILDPFLADQGVTLGRGLNLLDNRTGGPEPLRRADQGGDVTVYMNVSVDDLAKLATLGQFMTMIQTARVDQRRTQRSGKVTAS